MYGPLLNSSPIFKSGPLSRRQGLGKGQTLCSVPPALCPERSVLAAQQVCYGAYSSSQLLSEYPVLWRSIDWVRKSDTAAQSPGSVGRPPILTCFRGGERISDINPTLLWSKRITGVVRLLLGSSWGMSVCPQSPDNGLWAPGLEVQIMERIK